ncbi:hypothetical protein HDV00_007293 [Rhizophlyctis rosea]|nr:hypothetical protein HDV00_007293 [Rhizophlyctis rosea]
MGGPLNPQVSHSAAPRPSPTLPNRMPQTRLSRLHRDQRDINRRLCWLACWRDPLNPNSTRKSYLHLPTLKKKFCLMHRDIVALQSYLLPHEIEHVEPGPGCYVFFMHKDQADWAGKQGGMIWSGKAVTDETVRNLFRTKGGPEFSKEEARRELDVRIARVKAFMESEMQMGARVLSYGNVRVWGGVCRSL